MHHDLMFGAAWCRHCRPAPLQHPRARQGTEGDPHCDPCRPARHFPSLSISREIFQDENPTGMAPRVAIVGAGVAGSFLGRALALRGIPSKIYDAAAGPGDRLRRGLGLWPNSRKALVDVKLGEYLDSQAHFVPPAAYRARDGSWLSGCSARPDNLHRVACVEQNSLLAALAAEPCLDISWDKRVVRVEAWDGLDGKPGTREGAVIHFEDGSSEETDLVVGCDGAQSVVRRSMFPGASVMYSGRTCLSAIVDVPPTDRPFETLSRSVGHHHMGIRPGSPVRFAAVPLTSSHLFWFATLQAPRMLNGRPHAKGLANCLADEFSEWHKPIPELISAAAPDDLLCEPVYELGEPLASWSRGSATLVGDACAPLSHNLAQSASLAIECAHALSVALAGHEHLGAALSQYEAGLRGRVGACRTITGFTKVLAAMPEASGLMKFVPQPLNGWVFDAFLDLSLSGAGTYRGPATSASCAKAGRKR